MTPLESILHQYRTQVTRCGDFEDDQGKLPAVHRSGTRLKWLLRALFACIVP